MRWIWLLVVCAFGAGTGLGYLLRPAGRGPTRTARSPGLAGAEAEPPPAATEPADVPRGNGVIRGKVVLWSGEPLAGVLVVAVPQWGWPARLDRRGAAEPDDETRFRAAAARYEWWRAARRETRTAGDGTFAVRGLAERLHGVRAYREGYEIKAVPGQKHYDLRPGAVVDYVAKRVVKVHIDVQTPTSAPVPNTWVKVRGDAPGTSRIWSWATPWVELEPGSYEVSVSAGRRLEYRGETKTLLVPAEGEPPRLVLRLFARAGIRGWIRVPDGFTVEKPRVSYLRLAGESPPGRDWRGKSARVRRDHTFWIPEPEPGRYVLGVKFGSLARLVATKVVEVGEEPVEVEIVVPPPDPSEYVVVRVVGPDGRPVPKVRVSTHYADPHFGAGGGGEALRTKDGAIVTPYPEWDTRRYGEAQPDGRWFVEVRSRTYGKRKVEVAREPGAAVTVRLQHPAQLALTVRGYADSPHSGTLKFRLKQEKGLFWSGPVVGPDGVHTFGPLQPGSYDWLLVKTGAGGEWPIRKGRIDLASGPNAHAVDIPPLYTLRVEAVVDEPHAAVSIYTEDRSVVRLAVDADGVAEFSDIAAGTYRVHCEGKTGVVRVPYQLQVRLR